MTSFTARDGAGRLLDPATPEVLRPFLYRCRDDHAGPVELTSSTDGSSAQSERTAQASPQADASWSVRVASADGTDLIARTPNTDAVFDLLRSWAADDGWWSDAFSWGPATNRDEPEDR